MNSRKIIEFKRSREERKSDDQIGKKTMVLGLVTLFLFVFIILVGVPLLIRFAVFLGDIKLRVSKDQKEKILPPLPPTIVMPYEATNTSDIVLKGYAEPKTRVEIFIDNSLKGTYDVGDNGEFKTDKIKLKSGENSISGRTLGIKGVNSEESKQVPLIYDDEAPVLTLTNPSEDSVTVDSPDYDIRGKTETGSNVTVNGRLATIEENGEFVIKFQLSPGKNELEVIVRDQAQNETRKKVAITYDI